MNKVRKLDIAVFLILSCVALTGLAQVQPRGITPLPHVAVPDLRKEREEYYWRQQNQLIQEQNQILRQMQQNQRQSQRQRCIAQDRALRGAYSYPIHCY